MRAGGSSTAKTCASPAESGHRGTENTAISLEESSAVSAPSPFKENAGVRAGGYTRADGAIPLARPARGTRCRHRTWRRRLRRGVDPRPPRLLHHPSPGAPTTWSGCGLRSWSSPPGPITGMPAHATLRTSRSRSSNRSRPAPTCVRARRRRSSLTEWSVRKVMRRSIWHLRLHTAEARSTLGSIWLG